MINQKVKKKILFCCLQVLVQDIFPTGIPYWTTYVYS